MSFFDKIKGKPSAAEVAAEEQRRRDEEQRQRDIITGQIALAKSPEGQKWREDLRKNNIAETEEEIKFKERYLKLMNRPIETDEEIIRLKRKLEDIKKGNPTNFDVKLAQLRDSNLSTQNSNASAMSLPNSSPMPMSNPNQNTSTFVPYNYYSTPGIPLPRRNIDVMSNKFQVPKDFDEEKAMDEIQDFDLDSHVSSKFKAPKDFDEEKAMQDLNDADFDGGKRKRYAKTRKAKRSRKTKKSRKSSKSRTSKKSRKY
jgi:hypothetical protein